MGDRPDAAGRVVWGVGTPRSFRVHWLLHELGLDYETRQIGSRTGETQTSAYTALNPRQKIPVLEDGDLVLAESAAIVTYLAERYGAGRGIVPPPGRPERAHYFEWCFFTMTELDAHTLYVLRRHGDLASLYGEAPAALAAARAYFVKQAGVVELQLADGRPHVLGDTFTGADVLLQSCLDWAHLVEIELGARCTAYRGRHAARPAYRRAFAHNFAGLTPGAGR